MEKDASFNLTKKKKKKKKKKILFIFNLYCLLTVSNDEKQQKLRWKK